MGRRLTDQELQRYVLDIADLEDVETWIFNLLWDCFAARTRNPGSDAPFTPPKRPGRRAPTLH